MSTIGLGGTYGNEFRGAHLARVVLGTPASPRPRRRALQDLATLVIRACRDRRRRNLRLRGPLHPSVKLDDPPCPSKRGFNPSKRLMGISHRLAGREIRRCRHLAQAGRSFGGEAAQLQRSDRARDHHPHGLRSGRTPYISYNSLKYNSIF